METIKFIMENLNLILANSFFAGIISVVVSYIISIRLKKLDFKNEYYKEILKKRLVAYEHIEIQLSVLKAVVLGDDEKPFHLIFGEGENKLLEYQQNLFLAINKSLWIDLATTKCLENLNDFFFNINNKAYKKSESEIIEIGKQYYKKLSGLRFELENTAKKGLYNLHDMEKAFRPNPKNQQRIIREI
jgi:hypothetical protein